MGNIFSIQCGDAMAGRCWDCISKKSKTISFLCKVEDNLLALQAARDRLSEKRNALRRTVINQQMTLMEQPDQVQGWLSRADHTVTEATELLTRGVKERHNLCMAGYCSYNCVSTYKYGKSVARSLNRVNALISEEADLDRLMVNTPARQLESDLRELRNAKATLQARKQDVQQRIFSEEGPEMETIDEVQEWLSKAEYILAEADQLIEDGHQEVSKLLGGDNTNSMFAGRVAEHIKDIHAIHSQGYFSQVTEKVDCWEIEEERTVRDEEMLEEAWRLLHRVEVGIIGIYGMGGVGKTNLLAKINTKFATIPNEFDVVMWVSVSKDLKLDNIQKSIWELFRSVDASWLQKSCEEKAQDVFDVLQRKKFVLLLDDVWQKLNLEEIGVPLPNQQNGSKVVLTSRSFAVCRQMEATQTMKVNPLNQEEAWHLFKEKVGDINADVLHVAPKVADKCGGLPIALITIGHAMASRSTFEEWDRVLSGMRRSISSVKESTKVFKCLKFSYDCLPNDKVRNCFLHCSLFPKNFEIPTDGLVHYWHSEKLCTLSEGYEILSTLIFQCLLEEKGKYVKTHDVIQDMAIWIACECEKESRFFTKAGARLTQLLGNEEWHGADMVSFMGNSLKSTERISRYCDIEILFLSHNKQLKIVSEGLFQFMTRLTVLELSDTNIVTLSPNITALQSLEYLNLSYTKLEKLPIQMKSLVRLKYLNLEFSKCLKMIPVGVISNLTELRALYMLDCGPPFYEGEENNALSDGNTLMKELMCLKNLCELTVTVRSASFFHGICSNQILLNSMRALHLSFLFGTKSLNISSLVHARQLNLLEISLTCDLEELVIEPSKTDAPGCSLSSNLLVFRGLCEVKILDNIYMRHVTWLVFAPQLTVLTVKRNEKMEEIMSAEKLSELQASDAHLTPFPKLRKLELDDLPVLKSICPESLLFPFLKQIYVRECRALKKLPLNSESAGGGHVVIEAEESWWNQLTWEDDQTRAAFSSCFQGIGYFF